MASTVSALAHHGVPLGNTGRPRLRMLQSASAVSASAPATSSHQIAPDRRTVGRIAQAVAEGCSGGLRAAAKLGDRVNERVPLARRLKPRQRKAPKPTGVGGPLASMLSLSGGAARGRV